MLLATDTPAALQGEDGPAIDDRYNRWGPKIVRQCVCVGVGVGVVGE